MEEYGEDFVSGWPTKCCGCEQVIEACYNCSGSYLECPTCPECHGMAFTEKPCIHSYGYLRLSDEPVAVPTRPRTPPTHCQLLSSAMILNPYGRQQQRSRSSSGGESSTDESEMTRSVQSGLSSGYSSRTDSSSEHSSTVSSPSSSSRPSTPRASSPTPRRRSRCTRNAEKSAPGKENRGANGRDCGRRSGSRR